MADFIIRPWRAEDLPRLEKLWMDAFGDDADYIGKFRANFMNPDGCLVAEADGMAVSAMYILDGPILFPPDGTSLSTAYAYSLATDPAYRGRGIGSAVYRACVDKALQLVDAACVLPSEDKLYSFYEKADGSVPVSWAREALIPKADLTGPAPRGDDISAGEYYLRRKSILRGLPYAVVTTRFLAMESYHMKRFGGGYLSVDGDIAAVEMDGDTCRVVELLAPEGDWMEVLLAVAERFPAKEYLVRSPVFFPGPEHERPFMMASLGPAAKDQIPAGLWWGFALD